MLSWNIPYSRNPFFTGWQELLEQIHYAGCSTQALTGPGGIGKTEIALEYAYRHGDKYQTIFWINTSTILTSDIRRLADQLQTLAEARWLLVLDRIEQLQFVEHLQPKGDHQGHILLTTRATIIPQRIASTLSVSPFSHREAAQFFLRRSQILPDLASLNQAPKDLAQNALAIANESFLLEISHLFQGKEMGYAIYTFFPHKHELWGNALAQREIEQAWLNAGGTLRTYNRQDTLNIRTQRVKRPKV